ncbi:MAG: NAD(P)H-hydrate dehydratase [Pseudomonadota bacterium]
MDACRSCTSLDAALLRTWPLPEIAPDADKEDRGQILVVAGSREIAGAAMLAGTAAMRAGAGKLAIATAASVAVPLSLHVPEARVIGLHESPAGAFTTDALNTVADCGSHASAVLIGPGLMDEEGTVAFVAALLPMLAGAAVVLDALAMDVAKKVHRFAQPVVLTPHAGEMANLLGISKEEVVSDPKACAVHAAAQWNAVVALKGATTWLVDPQGNAWHHEADQPGLATSGSGDVLAGLIAGLAARQVPLVQATAWGVVLHALAGAALARKQKPIGFLARELAAEVPALLDQLRSANVRLPQ